jgi:hypothetical protein
MLVVHPPHVLRFACQHDPYLGRSREWGDCAYSRELYLVLYSYSSNKNFFFELLSRITRRFNIDQTTIIWRKLWPLFWEVVGVVRAAASATA